jgi:hypothetical protein
MYKNPELDAGAVIATKRPIRCWAVAANLQYSGVPLAETKWHYRLFQPWIENLRAETCALPESRTDDASVQCQ